MEPTLICLYPGIQNVALKIAYDNGMINRNVAEDEWLRTLNPVMQKYTTEDLKLISDFCDELTDDEQLSLAAGEATEIYEVGRAFIKPELLHIFTEIFEGEVS